MQISMINQLTRIAKVKVGSVKGNSRIYPQFRLPSQYADLARKNASVYKIDGNGKILLSLFASGQKMV